MNNKMRTEQFFIWIFLFSSIVSAQWYGQEPKLSSIIYRSIRFSSQSNGIIVGTKGSILHSSNSGDSWDSIYSPSNIDLEKVFFIDDLNGWIVGDSGGVFKSADGGLDWTIFANNIIEKLYSVHFENSMLGWIVGKHIIYKTTDGGISWQEKKRDNNSYYDVYFLNENTGLVAGDSAAYGIILKTTDGGETWNKIYETYFGYLSSISFVSQNTIYVAGENSIVVKSTDGGNSWFDIVVISQGNYDWQDVCFIDANKGWLVDLFGAVTNTTDGGLTWNEQIPRFIIPSSYYSICFLDSLKGWAVGSGENPNLYGRIIRTINGGVTDVKDDNNFPLIFNLSQNYPNPFNPGTVINYAVKNVGLVKIKVFDILGSEVSELVNETKEAGLYSIDFRAGNLPSGVYIYTLQVNSFSASKKMLILK